MAKYYPKKDYSSNLIAQYKFDEVNDDICIDSTGKYNGNYNGTISVTSENRNARSFNNQYGTISSTDYIWLNNQGLPLGKKSIKFKIKTNENRDFQHFLNTCNGSGQLGEYGISINVNNGKINITISNNGNKEGLLSTIIINDNKWHTVLYHYDGEYNHKLYIDDLVSPNITFTSSYKEINVSSNNLIIGTRPQKTYGFKGELDEIEIYNEVIEFTANLYLIQDKNNILYTLNGTDLVQAPLQILDEDNFINNGFTDTDLITKDLLLNKFENLEEVKLLAYTDDLEKDKCEMIYNCELFRPIDKLKKNSDICNILFKEV